MSDRIHQHGQTFCRVHVIIHYEHPQSPCSPSSSLGGNGDRLRGARNHYRKMYRELATASQITMRLHATGMHLHYPLHECQPDT